MKHLFALLTLGVALSGPAFAQLSTSQTNLDQSAARMEARNARGSQMAPVSGDQAVDNALRRCANLPAFYKVDCEARVRGQGQVDGSVIGGGVVKETVTTLPATELQQQMDSTPRDEIPASGTLSAPRTR